MPVFQKGEQGDDGGCGASIGVRSGGTAVRIHSDGEIHQCIFVGARFYGSSFGPRRADSSQLLKERFASAGGLCGQPEPWNRTWQ